MLTPDWHPLSVTRFVSQVIENRSIAVTQPPAILNAENMGLSWRKTACVAICKKDVRRAASAYALRVAASLSNRTFPGNIEARLRVSFSTNGANSSELPITQA